jgi:hypothetical protein
MRLFRVAVSLVLVLFSLSLYGQTEQPKKEPKVEEQKTGEPKKEQKIVVTGTLSRAMAIGAETTGWTIELDSETPIDGKPVHSVEISYPKTETLEKLNNQRVKPGQDYASARRGDGRANRACRVVDQANQEK